MTPNTDLLNEIHALRDEMQGNFSKAQAGTIIDISKLPDRLLALHNRVEKTDNKDQVILTEALNDVLDILDALSGEIQRRYNEISQQISTFENNMTDKKE